MKAIEKVISLGKELLEKSGLGGYFHHIGIMSDKKESDYLKLLKHVDEDRDLL